MNADDNLCKIIDLPKFSDERGSLSFVENLEHIPFEIKRVFYLYDVPGGATRAGHALKTCQQFLIAISGSFEVSVDDGTNRCEYTLNRAYQGLLIPPVFWRELRNFSSGSVCLVLASEPFAENDYFNDYEDFLSAVREGSA
ncbi:MAG: WxcM-like domain-containing protein [Chloroflexi bacterium]|nr:WxcM-like domain-containing protein [Chloroflexota bacterium]